MGSSLTLVADFKFSHSTQWRYSWQCTFSESTSALNSFKPPCVGRKRTGAMLTLFMASFGNSLGVSIHSFCSVVSPLSHTSPMFRLCISSSNKYVTGCRCHYAKAGRKALRQPAGQKDEEGISSISSFWQDRTYSKSSSTSFTFFCAIKQLLSKFSWLCRSMQGKDLGQGTEWQQTWKQ